jgi:glutamate 5-kinase
MLTDTEGLYAGDPKEWQKTEVIKTVDRVEDGLIRTARGKGSPMSSGGMESKLKAARIATQSGVGVIITKGVDVDFSRIMTGEEIGTYFKPAERKIRGKRKWIAFNPRVDGRIVIDDGGAKAIIESRKSLLPSGVVDVAGNFSMGSNVSIVNIKGREIARGLTNFSSEDLERIKGLQTGKIPQVLGSDSYFEEVVHRDNMVIMI